MSRKLEILIFLIVIIIPIAFLSINGPVLEIKNLSCSLEKNTECPPELMEKLTSLKGKSFFFSSPENEIRQLELNLYQLKTFKKTWPATLILEFSTKPNSYLLKKINQEELFLVTENGQLQKLISEQHLPQISISNWDEAISNDQINHQFHQINLSLIKFLNEQKINYQSIVIHNDQEIEIVISSDIKALLTAEGIEEEIIKLGIILEEIDLKSIDLQLNTIDLRFKLPVLTKS